MIFNHNRFATERNRERQIEFINTDLFSLKQEVGGNVRDIFTRNNPTEFQKHSACGGEFVSAYLQVSSYLHNSHLIIIIAQ